MTDFSPKQGSIYGGTKLTIQGGPFTTDLTETIVKVGYKWWEDINFFCYMISATETEVTCRIAHDLNREAKEYEVIAFASAYEESNCEMQNNCLFEFLDTTALPEVTGPASAVFDSVSGEYTIVIPGSGFTDTAADIEFYLNDVPQTVLSATGSEVVVQVDTLTSGLTTNSMDLYFSVGIPHGYTELASGITFAPQLVSLSSNTGSQAGSTITAIVKGVGIDDQVTLYDRLSGIDICQSSKVTSYGVLECITIEQEISVAAELGIKEINSNARHACASSSADCMYQTFSAA